MNCSFCLGYGSDPEEGTCPKCNPYCDRCQQRWSALRGQDCPRCVPSFPTIEERTKVCAFEQDFVQTLRRSAVRGVSYERMIQLVTWEWMHRAPTEALIPSHFEPASTLHPPEKVFPKRCTDCNACRIEAIGCACDGALDGEGCFLCEPEKHARPPCPV